VQGCHWISDRLSTNKSCYLPTIFELATAFHAEIAMNDILSMQVMNGAANSLEDFLDFTQVCIKAIGVISIILFRHT